MRFLTTGRCGHNSQLIGDAGASNTVHLLWLQATLLSYAKSLGDRPFLPDGPGTQLGRTGRFWGQHIWVSRLGEAVSMSLLSR